MKLTDKCEKDFEKWLSKQRFGIVYRVPEQRQPDIVDLAEYFWKLPQSMQYGVYVDFFDSVNIDIQMETGDFGGYNLILYDGKKYHSFEGISEARQEAREQAILKANEIYNH